MNLKFFFEHFGKYMSDKNLYQSNICALHAENSLSDSWLVKKWANHLYYISSYNR